MEHGPGTFENLQNLIRAANVAGVCPVVRVPRGMDIWIDRALDVGAGALLVPQIDTAEQVRAVVSAAKFGPVGTRGTNRFVRSACYGAVPGSEYFAKAQETMVIIQAEGKKAVENLDEILDVPGVDVLSRRVSRSRYHRTAVQADAAAPATHMVKSMGSLLLVLPGLFQSGLHRPGLARLVVAVHG